MKVRPTKHEVGGRLADFGTVQQEANVRRVRVFSTKLEAVANGGKTDVVAAGTLVDTLLHLAGDAGRSLMCHDSAPLLVRPADLLAARGGSRSSVYVAMWYLDVCVPA
jgi:hypothetical protein